MTAINFSPRFAPAVRRGDKRRTIRRKQKGKVGGKLQLYTGMRTKSCRKLGDAVCTSINSVVIAEKTLTLAGKKITAAARLKTFAQKDGHDDWASLTGWFEKRYGLPFKGYLHEWRLEKKAPQ